ncbi:MAG: class I SAM-dependent methyltransferase [Candidatus Dojkabacteria bacterium]|nr:MAG: class I SAM-dependent methyltransferase [Candidatus Dojkabacteria bacterium]
MATKKSDRWDKEYSKIKQIPSSNTLHSSAALQRFLESEKTLKPGRALDLGSGNGRNSIHLARLGWGCVGLEFSEPAVDQANQNAKLHDLSDKVTFVHQSVAEEIKYPDASFDLILDMMVMHSLSLNEREKMMQSVKRLLKPGGFFLFYTLSAKGDEFERLVRDNPGKEVNSYKFYSKGHTVTEKAFTKEELEDMLKPLTLVELEARENVTKAFGGEFERVYWYGVATQPQASQ